jgi:deoxyribodipyrimidine photolyase
LLDENCQNSLVYQQESCFEEIEVERLIKESLKKYTNVSVKRLWGATLCHLDDLQFKPHELGQSYTRYRQDTAEVRVRAILDTPKYGELPFPKTLS